jgi:hypothetical protein
VDDEHERFRRPEPANATPLPPERAFVVQLRPLSDPRGEVLVGRVEHITSGQTGRFTSAAELTAFIARIGRSAAPELDGDASRSGPDESPARRTTP